MCQGYNLLTHMTALENVMLTSTRALRVSRPAKLGAVIDCGGNVMPPGGGALWREGIERDPLAAT